MSKRDVDGWQQHSDGTWFPESECCLVGVTDGEVRIDLDEETSSDETSISIPLRVLANLMEQASGGEKKEVGRGVRPKYVDGHFPRWMKFGGWMAPNEKVGDVSNGNGDDIVNAVSEEVADKLIQARDEFVDRLQEIFDEHPESFNVYGPPLK